MKIRTETWLGHEIRFVEKSPGEWWAVAADVTKALGIRNAAQAINGNGKAKAKGLPDSQKGLCKLYTPGGEQEVLVVSEPGIYRLIFRSNKPEAEAFQDWVFDVLKSLRQSTGLEAFQIFRMLDKEHQREAMGTLCGMLRQPTRPDFIKANIIADKAVSTKFGHPKMLKKNQMTPEMLVHRQPILDDTVALMGAVDRFGLDLSVSKTIYAKHAN
ncbi:BRO-N domain-containing protein [Paenibacillus flagellatus]|uniref:Phage repressor protein n=1 Tax=Paenibacillus flagellatus TaxID=2211139 RepID=A0A2V5KFU5_9BACL|nr:BRO family protein [Paenibacillus flagellatus]PYI57053.1 phage repressor protein [Paenibacillus flagellatus]